MKRLICLLSLIFNAANVTAAEWVEASLNQIELAGAGIAEGVYFAKDTPYVTSFNCAKGRFLSIKDSKLADRTLSLALYAKSTSSKLHIYVTGCDSQGYINGVSAMLVSKP